MESKLEQSSATIEARRDLGGILRDFRNTIGFSRPKLDQKTGIGLSRIYAFEHAKALPANEEISQYIEVALQMGYPSDVILDAFSKAVDAEKRFNCEPAGEPSQTLTVAPLVPDAQIEREVLNHALENPKSLLEDTRWLSVGAQIQIERINFWEKIIADYNDTADFLLQYLEYVGSITKQTRESITRLESMRSAISALVKEHCSSLAREAQYLLKRYKKIGKVYDAYACDLPGYVLAKNQFYLGMTLNEALLSAPYTRRYAQTLQARALQTFQKRVEKLYDE